MYYVEGVFGGHSHFGGIPHDDTPFVKERVRGSSLARINCRRVESELEAGAGVHCKLLSTPDPNQTSSPLRGLGGVPKPWVAREHADRATACLLTKEAGAWWEDHREEFSRPPSEFAADEVADSGEKASPTRSRSCWCARCRHSPHARRAPRQFDHHQTFIHVMLRGGAFKRLSISRTLKHVGPVV